MSYFATDNTKPLSTYEKLQKMCEHHRLITARLDKVMSNKDFADSPNGKRILNLLICHNVKIGAALAEAERTTELQ